MAENDIVEGVLAGDRTALGRAITKVESTKPEHADEAQELLHALMPHSGNSQRIGISGVPGVGKSTFVDAFGSMLTGDGPHGGHHVAVLAVDPSSSRSGGSILGDKTRMARLAVDPNAFIRPSPTTGTLGGVTRRTRESIVIVEAAGFDVVLVETVGVGQSETLVSEMVDFFLVLMLAGAGDELQGIKKGLLEVADMLAVNKADGDNEMPARRAAMQYETALHLMAPVSPSWTPPVVTCSALHETGLSEIWTQIDLHRTKMDDSGERHQRRQSQQLRWMWSMIEERVLGSFREDPRVQAVTAEVQSAVAAGQLSPVLGAERLLATHLAAK